MEVILCILMETFLYYYLSYRSFLVEVVSTCFPKTRPIQSIQLLQEAGMMV